METIDFKKDHTYKAATAPEIIDVPKMLFVMVDGQGAPDSSEAGKAAFQQAMQILFGIVYSIKFWDKKHTPPAGYVKFTLGPIEGLWWTKSGKNFDLTTPDDWEWTVMLRVPEFVTPEYFKQVVDELVDKKQTDIYRKARLEPYHEGTVTQILHIGPYDQEEPNIIKMHAFATDSGHQLRGKHHELYFGDPRRTAPEKLRTVLRQPII